MGGSRRGGGQGVQTPLKNQKNIGLLRNTGPIPLKITNLPSQHSMLGHYLHASETPFNGVSLAGRCRPTFSGIWIPSSTKKVGPPLKKLSGSAHGVCVCARVHARVCVPD